MDKLISVIVPVYNVQAFIRKCLDSLQNQTYKNLEIILVDDGTPDKSGEICDEYAAKDSRFKVIHKENGGLCSARNAGLRAATGEYIGFVDSDDWVKEDMFEYLLKNALEYQADVSVCRYYRVKAGKDINSKCDGAIRVLTPEETIEDTVERFVIRTTFWNKLFHRSVFEGIEFPEGRTYEGTFMMHKVLQNATKIVSGGEPKYYYMDNETSIINTKSMKNAMNYIIAHITRYEDLQEEYPHLKQKMMRGVVKAVTGLSYVCENISQEELDANRSDLERMARFIEAHMDEIIEWQNLRKRQIKELKNICRLTRKNFKKARVVRGLDNKIQGVKKVIFSRKGPKTVISHVAPVLDDEKKAKLRRLQMAEVELMDELVRICNKHHLRYYLYGGTLLGAVRHKGFIPWDDDMDIVMPRKDYERFGKICQKELNPKYFYQTCFTDGEFPMLFAKLRKNGTYVCEEKWKDKKMHSGIFIDILPLDHFPKTKFMGDMVLHAMSLLHQVCAFNNCASDRVSAQILFRLMRKLPVKWIYRMRDLVMKATNAFSSKKKYYISFGSHYRPMRRRVLEKDWFGKGTYMEFEGKKYRVPSRWEDYLHHLFGTSYMELPPESDRICHLDFDSTIISEEDK